jgi:type IV conjugative transfer system protein TraL
MRNKCYYAPQYINKNNVLWWEKDEIKFVFAPLIIVGIFMGYFFSGLIGTLLIGVICIKIRKNKPEGYIKHMQYFHVQKDPRNKGLMSMLFRDKTFPNSAIRHITG